MSSLYPLPTNLKFVFFYNVAAFTLWFCCLGRFSILLPLVGKRFLPGGIADYFHVVSMLPLLGVFVKLLFTRKKVSVRDGWSLANGVKMAWICYGVIFPHPRIARHLSYSVLIVTWCCMYMVHFLYYAFKVKTKRTPLILFWLQFHNFYLTLPVTTMAEMVLLFLSLAFVEDYSWLEMAFQVVLVCYVPMAYVTWSYMMERKRVRYDYVVEKRRQAAAAVSRGSAYSTATSPTSRDVELRDLSSHR